MAILLFVELIVVVIRRVAFVLVLVAAFLVVLPFVGRDCWSSCRCMCCCWQDEVVVLDGDIGGVLRAARVIEITLILTQGRS